MSTFGQIQTRVAMWTVNLPTIVGNEIPLFINEAVKAIQRKRNWDAMRFRVTANTTAGTRVLAARPADWKAPRHDRPWREAANGSVAFLGWLPSEEEALKLYNLSPLDTGAPRWLRLADPTDDDETENIEVYPLSNSNSDWTTAPAGEYRIRIPYWRFLPDLSAAGDSNWFTVHGSEAIEHLAAAKAFWADEDGENATLYEQRGWQFVAKLEAFEKRARLGSMRGLSARADVHGSRSGGRLDSGDGIGIWRPDEH